MHPPQVVPHPVAVRVCRSRVPWRLASHSPFATEPAMIGFLILLGQCLCVVGLIYAVVLATVKIDWLENLPTDSLESDSPGNQDIASVEAARPLLRSVRRRP
jgi:hypothetical protein